jgi:hypothetical protein
MVVCRVVQQYATSLIGDKQYDRACHVLKMAIEKIRMTRAMLLTGLHPLFALCCLKTRNYALAANIIDDMPCEIDSLHRLDSKAVLSYYYYAGTIALALRKPSTALELLSVCFHVPAQNISLIHLEAYKKYVLTYIIVHGTVS